MVEPPHNKGITIMKRQLSLLLAVSLAMFIVAPVVLAQALYSGPMTSTTIDVPATTWVRVRAGNGPSCGGWKNGDITATYTPWCV